ncbi:hypothetical protein, conserved [Babesia bigemina]|uniref:Uncharacterized protein n=1 Tax=Babesia bigemina TaxID=5866 RepID=A0A061D5G6_BABBI|nr:hypothetical protein, conserved [Babesia bigemina]CDR94209.1 hypothetical protein, conserved [Babesia bigemina]|eukprot:XP_012766395.1 hypothetical protein, conserved [Babesia bigemina]
MKKQTTHNVGIIRLRSGDSRMRLPDVIETSTDYVVKVEIDVSVLQNLHPRDVLEALRSSQIDDDVATIVIRGHKYHCEFITRKATTLLLGENPSSCTNITDRYLGTIFVSPVKTIISAALHTRDNWRSEHSYRKFHKSTPFGSDQETIPR